MTRTAEIERITNETNVRVALDLDGTGQARIATDIPFLDHMLHHVAVHGLMDLDIAAHGDLEIDAHHTAEDIAIVFGAALDQALGERTGITRIAHSYVPMDEALGFVAIDLSGRGYAVVDAEFTAPLLGTLPSSLIAHFFETLASRGLMNLHARVLYGRDDHHKAEALFKALGRALGAAVAVDPRRQITSTKGTLK